MIAVGALCASIWVRLGSGLAATVLLSGCIAIDTPEEGAVFINGSGEAVVVHIEGTGQSFAVERVDYRIPGTECVGTGIVVTTVDGEELAAFDGGACGQTTLEVHADGSVTVTDTWGSEETRAPRP